MFKRLSPQSKTILGLVVLGALIGFGILLWQRARNQGLPAPGSPRYTEMVTAYFTGVIALQVGDDTRAESELKHAVSVVPDEPAAWADLGVFYLRRGDVNGAAQQFEEAARRAPRSDAVQYLWGILERQRGHFDAAASRLQRALALNPRNLKAKFALAQSLSQGGKPGADAQSQKLLQEIVTARPRNLVAALELARVSAKRGDAAALKSAVAGLSRELQRSPAAVRAQLAELQRAARSDARSSAIPVAFLGNVLRGEAAYQSGLSELGDTPATGVAPLARFLKLPMPSAQPSPPDTALRFTPQPLSAPKLGSLSTLSAPYLSDGGSAAVFGAGTNELFRADIARPPLPLPPDPPAQNAVFPPGAHAIAALDWNFDFLNDLAVATPRGLRLFQQGANQSFADATAKSGLPAAVLNAAYEGAWPADVEADGDLDLVLGQLGAPPRELRNNGDGTWTAQPLLGVQPQKILVGGVRDFAWGDLDDDDDNDAALLDDAGRLHVFTNERSGHFVERAVPPAVRSARALALADTNNDGTLDLVLWGRDGTLRRVSDVGGASWQVAPIAPLKLATTSGQLFAADMDNNGGIDLVASAGGKTQVLLSDEAGRIAAAGVPLDVETFGVADLNDDGKLDLAGLRRAAPVRLKGGKLNLSGLSQGDTPLRLLNQSAKPYRWTVIRPHALTTGDRRINPFGVGGAIEMRAGLLFQKVPIEGPQVHFGLGDHETADSARFLWPNGDAQAEFELKSGQKILTVQRLTGSCPYLFAWNGHAMSFVKDCNWRSPLGLKINAQDTAGVVQTGDWAKIRGDQLAPRDGFLDLRVTADLWEAHFFDEVKLMCVDHPPNTEAWVDERFALPMPPLEVHATGPLHSVRSARDDRGRDVTATVQKRDGNYLDTFGRGPFQGITRDHWVEVDLSDAPRTGKLFLIAEGWLHPTDSSINVALGQGHRAPPQGLSLEVFDAAQPDNFRTARSGSKQRAGGWTPARAKLGFPAGKNKAILLDLTGVFRAGAPRRLRLRTNLEIFWDRLGWAVALPPSTLRERRLEASQATLRFRGFSRIRAANASSPELPDSYVPTGGTAQKWSDLSGFYTRFGDVKPLLRRVDDRYVIMNAGDEMVLRFASPAPPPPGWTRDYVFMSDGWTKDGNLNTTFSKTLLPMPAHDLNGPPVAPGRLQDDPVVRRHPRDWQTYQTRYVAPRAFAQAMRPALDSP